MPNFNSFPISLAAYAIAVLAIISIVIKIIEFLQPDELECCQHCEKIDKLIDYSDDILEIVMEEAGYKTNAQIGSNNG